ncbi:retrotransposon-related protein [Tanacetum coccineum]
MARVTEARLDDQGTVAVAPKIASTSGGSQYQRSTSVVKTSLLPAPPKAIVSTNGKPLAIKWISPTEGQEHLSSSEEVAVGDDEAIGTTNVHVLIDNGSTHNFMRPYVVERMRLPLEATKAFKVYIGSGETLLGENVCSRVNLHMQGLEVEVDLYVLPMQGPDVVLGIQWLQRLGKVTHDYAHQIMEFVLGETTYTLKGFESLRMKKISLHRMQALLDMEDVYGIYECHDYTLQGESNQATLTAPTSSGQPELELLLTRFDDLFQVPTCLPPPRSIDHRIHLLPNTKPVNVRPYRYPHYQKEIHQEMIQGEVLSGFRRVNGLLLYNNHYYLGQESKLKTLLLEEFHATPSVGYEGIKKMLVGLSALFLWKGMPKSVEGFIKRCVVCQQTKYFTDAPRVSTASSNVGRSVGGCHVGLHYGVTSFTRYHRYFGGGRSFNEVCSFWDIAY